MSRRASLAVTAQENKERFVERYLDPGSRLGEVLFGLIMVLSATCLPAAVPFLLLSEPTHALRASNFLLIAMLFVVGHMWAQYAHTNRLLAGLVMVAIGLALVGAAVLLGG